MRTLLAAIALLLVWAVLQPAAAQGNALMYCQNSSGVWLPVSPSNPCPLAATVSPGTAITPIVSTSLEASHVFKNTAGSGVSFYATNLTGGASGFLLILNATSVPADGAVTPLVCVPFSGGVASANYQGIPAGKFSTGIVGVVSSATTCFTKTTGVLTAFLSGLVQ